MEGIDLPRTLPIKKMVVKIECIHCHEKFEYTAKKLNINQMEKSEKIDCPHCKKYFYGFVRIGKIGA
jgi:DNA-directed RNA polymerase subunit RPC12/RpoP